MTQTKRQRGVAGTSDANSCFRPFLICLPARTSKLIVHAALKAMAARRIFIRAVTVGTVVACAGMMPIAVIAILCRGGREGPETNTHTDGKTNKTNCSEKSFHARLLLQEFLVWLITSAMAYQQQLMPLVPVNPVNNTYIINLCGPLGKFFMQQPECI